MRSHKIVALLSSIFLSMPMIALADNGDLSNLLNKVTLNVSAEQWVTSKTAVVNIGINAAISDADLGKVQSNMLDKLNQISNKADWHIISFNRTLDQSGLETIQASAQARLPESELAGMRDKAKAISKPGETFTLDNVQFVPSDDDFRAANTALRTNIYQQVKAEVDQLNKMYPDQKYFVHDISFVNELMPRPMGNTMFMAKAMVASAGGGEQPAVGDKLRISATVVLSAAPTQDVVKMVHN